jgi:hypothetical protein
MERQTNDKRMYAPETHFQRRETSKSSGHRMLETVNRRSANGRDRDRHGLSTSAQVLGLPTTMIMAGFNTTMAAMCLADGPLQLDRLEAVLGARFH